MILKLHQMHRKLKTQGFFPGPSKNIRFSRNHNPGMKKKKNTEIQGFQDFPGNTWVTHGPLCGFDLYGLILTKIVRITL